MSGDNCSLLRPFIFGFVSQLGILPTLALFTRFVFDLGQGIVIGRPVENIIAHAAAFVVLLAVPYTDTHPTVATAIRSVAARLNKATSVAAVERLRDKFIAHIKDILRDSNSRWERILPSYPAGIFLEAAPPDSVFLVHFPH